MKKGFLVGIGFGLSKERVLQTTFGTICNNVSHNREILLSLDG